VPAESDGNGYSSARPAPMAWQKARHRDNHRHRDNTGGATTTGGGTSRHQQADSSRQQQEGSGE
jgi:hypothetical protein